MVTGILFGIYFLFGRVLPWSLAVTITLLLGGKKTYGSSIFIVILLGLIEDVVHVRPLGVSSVLLLCVLGVVWITRRFYQSQWAWWYVVGALGYIVFTILTGGIVTAYALLWHIGILWLIRWLLVRIAQPEGIYVGQ